MSDILSRKDDAAEWLAKWDSGEAVWTVEMGGIGPGYEQCIQITMAEMLRYMLATKPDRAIWDDKDLSKLDAFRKARDEAIYANPIIDKLGLSGAQAGAAGNLSTILYLRGTAALEDDEVKDRRILVSKNFPR